eukprot:TRINITY_DN1604_c0_g3_i2.p1 TRINITY_DN1604_c0_g3~~TRINITY_DN1604_c0_g3_i2.p1  ORF type:complete len:134 (+),score=19.21 TRINITY_DN1604_c0_g3_i2:249-650(+)
MSSGGAQSAFQRRRLDPKTGKIVSVANNELTSSSTGPSQHLQPSKIMTESENEIQFDLTNVPFPTIFNRFDVIVFIIAFLALGFYIKTHHRVDIFLHSWNFIKPRYDEGVDNYWASAPWAQSPQEESTSIGEL